MFEVGEKQRNIVVLQWLRVGSISLRQQLKIFAGDMCNLVGFVDGFVAWVN